MKPHFVLGDKVRIYKRERSSIGQCSCRIEGKEFAKATEQFLAEYDRITNGERNQRYVKGHGEL